MNYRAEELDDSKSADWDELIAERVHALLLSPLACSEESVRNWLQDA